MTQHVSWQPEKVVEQEPTALFMITQTCFNHAHTDHYTHFQIMSQSQTLGNRAASHNSSILTYKRNKNPHTHAHTHTGPSADSEISRPRLWMVAALCVWCGCVSVYHTARCSAPNTPACPSSTFLHATMGRSLLGSNGGISGFSVNQLDRTSWSDDITSGFITKCCNKIQIFWGG